MFFGRYSKAFQTELDYMVLGIRQIYDKEPSLLKFTI